MGINCSNSKAFYRDYLKGLITLEIGSVTFEKKNWLYRMRQNGAGNDWRNIAIKYCSS